MHPNDPNIHEFGTFDSEHSDNSDIRIGLTICPEEVITISSKFKVQSSKLAIVVVAGLFLAGCFHKGKPQDLGLPETGEGINIEDKVGELGKQFGVTIPEDVDKAVLESTAGQPSSGLATRDRKTGGSLTILVNLPDTKLGYTARLSQDDKKFDLGNLSVSKGGWMVEKTLTEEAAELNTVEVLEGPNVVLRGQFK